MKNLRIMERKDKKKFLQLLKKQFGFEDKLDYNFLINNKNKIFIVNKEIADIDLNNIRINSAGLYIAEFSNNEVRLSIEGSQLVGKKANKNIVELDKKQARDWLKGIDLEISQKSSISEGLETKSQSKTQKKGFVILKHNNDFLGSGKAKEDKILNFVPKIRRLNVKD